jgi:hypothetical protein
LTDFTVEASTEVVWAWVEASTEVGWAWEEDSTEAGFSAEKMRGGTRQSNSTVTPSNIQFLLFISFRYYYMHMSNTKLNPYDYILASTKK